ncbi:hypothetical protein Acy02nite_48560 [Actinoplanes cyaneus]|uniref:Type II restriction enzyme NaeI domain-containing protein n=1 Tax=Actinoplanes cyaneus TaxID=52696 RepID=A0A919IJ33_9ACTN|nr:NaeI family type II restriction endonuclease [Actinoplanes cyaneus]MCW2138701.1 Restriction endonuclease NaeI [Actinoplanes cyaneus]GID66975.1 hypothetical protein Acy02nite_48560 [Actinoplanes cyaneus]
MQDDEALSQVAAHLLLLDPHGSLTGHVLRDTFDQIYDGQRTGRYSIDRLAKTERTHFGSLVEINLQRRFQYDDGDDLDFGIAGHDVDAKYSMTFGRWMIPVEAQGKLCMLIHADDYRSRWSLGVIRADLNILTKPNRDQKRNIKSAFLERGKWLFRDAPLPVNTLLSLPEADRLAIEAQPPGKHRVAELMRRAEGRVVNRASIEATAQQRDSMKRVRANGGALDLLTSEGFLLLSGTRLAAQRIAYELGLPHPPPGGFVPVKVAAASLGCTEPTATVRGVVIKRWRPGDEPLDTGPLVSLAD